MSTARTEAAQVIYKHPESLCDVNMRFCPGCTHGIAHRLVAEVIDELGLGDRSVAIASVGCSVYAYEYFDLDAVQAAHGRAPAVATGIKRSRPDSIVFTYQGDGDLAAIGIGELIHSAGRGENITIIFINNAVFGMTQGQMAPTTLLGMKTTTTPLGRSAPVDGMPMQVCELLRTLPGVAYLARATMIDPRAIRDAKKCIRRAFQAQVEGRGLSLVELVSTCPTWWQRSPLEAAEWLRDNMLPAYPLGVFRDWEEGEADA
ncbi:MAG: 2-oxoglutarate oxidoreductase [Armatimonadetes bacterium]|nr:2-oxoglutarate oxidoreductase [Armatimonadota bacterium]